MVIQHNLAAMNANRQFKINTDRTKKIAEKLSSGYKINRSADDAAGLAMSEKMRRQIRGLGQAAENIQEGIGYVQTAEGALNEVHDMLQRMNELAVKSANGTNTPQDREYIDAEVQQLKEELDRVFDTTTFNEIKIWEPDPDARVQIGSEMKQAVKFRTISSSIDVTNANCGVIAVGNYKINATEADGVFISWTGYDGVDYETKKISWADLEANDYTFEMSDYFDDTLKDANGNQIFFEADGDPIFKHKISFTIEEYMKEKTTEERNKDIIDAINGRTFGASEYAYMSGRFETNTGAAATKDMTVKEVEIYYQAAYASNANTVDPNGTKGIRDFDAADDAFLEAADSSGTQLTSGSTKGNLTASPGETTVAGAQASDKGWTFTFDMDGIGKVEASSYSIDYAAPYDSADDDYKHWWYWEDRKVNGVVEWYKVYDERTLTGGTLDDVMSVLTGAKGTDTPGLLDAANAQNSNGVRGYIDINFNMKLADGKTYTYGANSQSSYVGSFTLRVNVKENDTEQDVLNRINNTLNDQTILDFYSTSNRNDSATISYASAPHKIEVPIWGGKCKFWVQAGAEANQHIEIQYEALSNKYLKLEDMNVLDVAGCNDAIDKIKSALIEVSKQRSDFGAYQNRLEKAYNVNKNTEENTQYSESRIRDTDMAKTMIEYSNHNVLLQAGQAILSQMNNYNQGVLQLLQ